MKDIQTKTLFISTLMFLSMNAKSQTKSAQSVPVDTNVVNKNITALEKSDSITYFYNSISQNRNREAALFSEIIIKRDEIVKLLESEDKVDIDIFMTKLNELFEKQQQYANLFNNNTEKMKKFEDYLKTLPNFKEIIILNKSLLQKTRMQKQIKSR